MLKLKKIIRKNIEYYQRADGKVFNHHKYNWKTQKNKKEAWVKNPRPPKNYKSTSNKLLKLPESKFVYWKHPILENRIKYLTDYQKQIVGYIYRRIYEQYYTSSNINYNYNKHFYNPDLQFRFYIQELRTICGYIFTIEEIVNLIENIGLVTIVERPCKYRSKSRLIVQLNEIPIEGHTKHFIKEWRLNKRISKILNKKFSSYDDNLQQVILKTINVEFQITRSEFELYMKDKWEETDREIDFNSYLKYREHIWKSIELWNNSELPSRLKFITVDKFSGRLHTPYTRVPSLFKKKTSIKKAVTLDLKTSQPVLLGQYIYDKYGKNSYTDFINNSTDFYSDLQKKFKLSTRNEAKEMSFKILFGNPKKLLKEFPDLKQFVNDVLEIDYDVKKRCKKYYSSHKNLSCYLQRLETKVFRHIWSEIIKCFDIDFITVHDSITVENQYKYDILNICNKTLKQYLPNVNFEIKFE